MPITTTSFTMSAIAQAPTHVPDPVDPVGLTGTPATKIRKPRVRNTHVAALQAKLRVQWRQTKLLMGERDGFESRAADAERRAADAERRATDAERRAADAERRYKLSVGVDTEMVTSMQIEQRAKIAAAVAISEAKFHEDMRDELLRMRVEDDHVLKQLFPNRNIEHITGSTYEKHAANMRRFVCVAGSLATVARPLLTRASNLRGYENMKSEYSDFEYAVAFDARMREQAAAELAADKLSVVTALLEIGTQVPTQPL